MFGVIRDSHDFIHASGASGETIVDAAAVERIRDNIDSIGRRGRHPDIQG
jgi:hypothetical protein